MIKALIFDCFGVLATEAWVPFKAKYFGNDPVRYKEAGALMKQANRGLITHDEFLDNIAQLASVSPEEATKAIRQNVPNESLFDYMRHDLKPKYKLSFLSNVADDYMRQLFTEEQRSLFDSITLSYKTGYVKPEAKAYTVAADQLGVEATECVFVDDSVNNVAGAEAAGMKAILYRDFAQFKTDLEKLLANSKG